MALPAPIHALTRPQLRAATPLAISGQSNRVSNVLPQAPPSSIPTNVDVLTETHQIVIPLPPGATRQINIPGISYYFGFVGTTAGVPNNFSGLEVRAINSGAPRAPIVHVQGTGLRFGTQPFSGLEILNRDNGNTVLITLVVGGGVPNNTYDEFIDKRVIIATGTGSITVSGTVTVTNTSGTPIFVNSGPTFNVGYKTRDGAWADTLAAGASQVVADGYTGKQRKAIVFANDDNIAVLQVLDTTGNILGSVQPGTSFYLETGAAITLKNPTAGGVTCHIGEVYYS